ncbi:sushi domain-containing protein 6-like [Dunckerocampus dactyliophorus]|uniref:sushi domain-containing protein 6-like n=1 Tax=Dunckerocampus dactyliophorus TaxID=161453 RepID=UPI0024049A6A|nr:sushi domain-containing protein 6-like [Dunckerocampus dactyliophorus]XP_054653331.1 sushi domain-containing protein 6-like [Dunckerocampus dactyliophorus]
MCNGKTEATSEVCRGHTNVKWSVCLLLALTVVTSGQGLVCQPPHAPKNGGYNCQPSPCRRLSHGTVIEFYCDEGYTLKGDYKFLTCQYGEWDGPVQISCVKEQGCVRPYMVENSWVNHTETNRGLFPVGIVLQYSCDPGYLPDGPNILTCISPGRWSSEPPHCTQSDACLPLSEPENGGYNCHPSPCRMFSHGTVVEFFCHSGFILKGKYNYLTCQDGQWDGPMQISCVKQVCQPPYQPENGGYTCHPSQCRRLSHGTVIEYFCNEGYILKGDYKYLTCQYGKWDGLMQISCVMEQDRGATLPLGMPALSIVSSTASSVALILLLVVLFVLLQPKLKSFHRRDQGVSGQPVSIMVEGVQVNLPSYEEAVSGNTGSAAALNSESRVQIVLSEGQQATTPEAGPSRPASLKQLHSEMAAVHPLPLSSSSSASSSSWTLENAGGGALSSGDHHSLTLLDSEMDCSDEMPLLKEAGNMQDIG